MDNAPIRRKARTIKPIEGKCILSIPQGTEFMITSNQIFPNSTCICGYYICDGLPINEIWANEFTFI
jgi:hypothetical protein